MQFPIYMYWLHVSCWNNLSFGKKKSIKINCKDVYIYGHVYLFIATVHLDGNIYCVQYSLGVKRSRICLSLGCSGLPSRNKLDGLSLR